MGKKLIVFVVVAIATLSSFAQRQDGAIKEFPKDNKKEIVNLLIQRVDSLEHELSYLKLYYESYKLKTSLEIFQNNINNNAQDIHLYLITRNYDSNLCTALEDNYKASENNLTALEECIKTFKKQTSIEIQSSSYSEYERYELKSICKMIDYAYNAAKTTLNVYKLSLDAYKDNL